jgi:RHS repeat-associated protein
VQLSGSTPTANLISGGIDEIFNRADSTGAYTPLQDALGSTIALVDANGNLVTQYAYDPFGNTTVLGATSTNPSQYTGRENEGNGLYFYRARYYSPLLGRFINEDPLGFAGSGQNFYAYVFDSPTNQAVLAHSRPLPLAGRYTGGKPPNAGGGGNDDDDCNKERRNARDFCSDLEAMPRNSPEWKNYINIWGGNFERCVRGQISERCGGNRVE